MKTRSEKHHEIPKWLLKHFSLDYDETMRLWIGFKNTREIQLVSVEKAFVRKDANTRIDYQSRGDGTFRQVKSDPDEKILDRFDDQTSRAARDLIDIARRWRNLEPVDSMFSAEMMETCKRLIVAQARRTRESQDRTDLFEDKHDLYLDVLYKLAEEVGQQLPPRDVLLKDPDMAVRFDVTSQNRRANFSSGDHPILASKEEEFLAPLGLHVNVLNPTTTEFVIGSHGVTITQEPTTRLPLSPDVVISLTNRPGIISIAMCINEFVENHNRTALSISERIAGRSKETIEKLLATLD